MSEATDAVDDWFPPRTDERNGYVSIARVVGASQFLCHSVVVALIERSDRGAPCHGRSRRPRAGARSCRCALAEVLSPVTGNRDHDAGFMAEAPMARRFAAEFGKAVSDQPGCERSARHRAHRRILGCGRVMMRHSVRSAAEALAAPGFYVPGAETGSRAVRDDSSAGSDPADPRRTMPGLRSLAPRTHAAVGNARGSEC